MGPLNLLIKHNGSLHIHWIKLLAQLMTNMNNLSDKNIKSFARTILTTTRKYLELFRQFIYIQVGFISLILS